jgi:hypothetical protein
VNFSNAVSSVFLEKELLVTDRVTHPSVFVYLYFLYQQRVLLITTPALDPNESACVIA